MFDSRSTRPALLLAAAALLVVAPAAAPTAASGAGGPRITAKPHELMVNTNTTLTGRGFPANETIQLTECGRTSWMAPNDPCLNEAAKTVKTDRRGRFTTSFKAGLCPEGEAGKQPTSRVCYVGEVVWGEDTAELLGAAKLIVTYP